MTPLIGIIPGCQYEQGAYSYHVGEANISAVTDAGGCPLVLPYSEKPGILESYLELVDGLYFIGGGDILPDYFGESPLPGLGSLCPPRDAFEIRMYREAARRDLPVLGVCRGMQIINVAAGGTIYQDLAGQLPQAGSHKPMDLERSRPYHKVRLAPESRLAAIMGRPLELFVNSFHHEAVTAPDFQAVAWAPDGVIEAMESQRLTFGYGVQWHPEDMYRSVPVFAGLYRAFIQAAGDYRKGRRTADDGTAALLLKEGF